MPAKSAAPKACVRPSSGSVPNASATAWPSCTIRPSPGDWPLPGSPSRSVPRAMCAPARQLGRPATLEAHPLPQFYAAGRRLALGSDDPAMFGTDLVNEYLNAARLGLPPAALVRLAEMSFEAAFLPEAARRAYCDRLAAAANATGLVGL